MTPIVDKRFPLIELPTPCHRLPRLGAELGIGDLWAKRDDLTSLDVGGNKARKLEYLCAAALAAGCDVMVTGGATQSNHCRMTAAAAAVAGLGAVLVLGGDPPDVVEGNVVLDRLFDAELRFQGRVTPAHLEDRIVETCAELEAEGRRPYLVPLGGSSPLGALGYVDGAREIGTQVAGAPLVVCAVGSGGTYAGLAVGLGRHDRVMGIDVEAIESAQEKVAALAEATATAAGIHPPAGEPRLDTSQVGSGYGLPAEATREAITLAARHEGLVLDPVYSGKAMAGLAAACRDGQVDDGRPVVFLCSGGSPALFTHRFRRWFD